jgi:hypothetical protein
VREDLTDAIYKGADFARHAFHEILPHEEDRLNRARVARGILEPQIVMFETAFQRFFHNLVIATIFAFALKRSSPSVAILELGKRKHFRDAMWNWNEVVAQHGKTRIHLMPCHPERSRRIPWNCRWIIATGFDSLTSRALSPPAFPSMSRLPRPLHSRLRSE